MASKDRQEQKNKRAMLVLGCFVLGMLGMAYASVPLYKAFCQATGFAGTPKVSDVASDEVLDRKITVRFDSNVDPGLNWKFRPSQLKQTSNIGESVIATFDATNLSDHAIVGTASFNVAPAKAAEYFVKLDCFCFTEQVLQAGESTNMPVLYYIDPAIAEDRHMNDVKTITLSYTFYEKKNPTTVTTDTAANVETTQTLR
jgi:cytochrome c oxidase assembly protein subunit 11